MSLLKGVNHGVYGGGGGGGSDAGTREAPEIESGREATETGACGGSFPLGRVGGPTAADVPLAGVADVYRVPVLSLEVEGRDVRGGIGLVLFCVGWVVALSFDGCGGSLPVLLGVTAHLPVSLVNFLVFESGLLPFSGGLVFRGGGDGAGDAGVDDQARVREVMLRLDRTLQYVGSLFCAMVVCPYVWFVLVAAVWHLGMLYSVWVPASGGVGGVGGGVVMGGKEDDDDKHWSVFGATVGLFVSVPLLVQQEWVHGLVTGLCLVSVGMFYHPEFREWLGLGVLAWRCAAERVLFAVWVYCVCASAVAIGT